MIFDGNPTRDIKPDDLRRLVTDHVPEGKHLDYKEIPYDPRDPKAASELPKDVTAFANADGGYLVIGVKEDAERRAVAFVSVADPEAVRRSMIDRCLERIDPRLRELDVRAFDVDGATVLLVHVPESDRKPLCAKPDAEHHYFWRRYEDGNKLMSTAEIRECFEGDRVHRELAALRGEFAEHRLEDVQAREAEMDVNDSNLLQLQTPERFLSHMEQQFLAATGDRPYYRLWATPIPVNALDLRDQGKKLVPLLRNPPKLRDGGWDVTPVGDFRRTGIGLVSSRTDFRHLRLLWNGHLEFWNRADDLDFHWDEANSKPPFRFLFPYAIIEAAECFVRLVREICRVADYHGDLRFGLELRSIQGQYLLPGGPETFRYRRSRGMVGQTWGPQPFGAKNLVAAPFTKQADELPDAVAWQLASQAYDGFGYTDEEIPFFDSQHMCTLDESPRGGTDSS